eukprot:CAMPEP_0119334978 /NCGR_PEP_ID=MMETSP1333-20130426/88443_1 /TAXON_ID=418940 /ORGANISM="Scyphosphaera apsteinii, Strain RCC1455" /LENGTH=298 /DNA_ID=CAMNT_0007345415 /DNA_START=124 /DNA_END=1020 /DNA_ORIENTATION=+
MPKFGGKGTMRQTCVLRACEFLVSAQREAALEAAAKRAELREATREVREVERHKREAEREAARQSRKSLGLKVKSERIPSVALEEMTPGWGEHTFTPGSLVEVIMREEGLAGAAYTGSLVPMPELTSKSSKKAKAGNTPKQVCVQFDELLADEDSEEKLLEIVDVADVRLQPPPTPAGFHRLLDVGDAVEMQYEDGWWEMEIEEVKNSSDGQSATSFRVASVMYANVHTVHADVLRPRWLWAREADMWRYELEVGHGCVTVAGEAFFHFARGVPRSHNDIGNRRGPIMPLIFALEAEN